MYLINTQKSETNFEIEQTPLRVTSQTCHNLLFAVFLKTPMVSGQIPKSKLGNNVFTFTSFKNRKEIAIFASWRISSFYDSDISADDYQVFETGLHGSKNYVSIA